MLEGYLGDPLNDPNKWTPNMRMPSRFNRDKATRFQCLINRLVGTSNDQPILRLDWGPEVFEWRPYPLGSEPFGYTFPSWIALWDLQGREVAAPRWVLMERCEPEQYAPNWEAGRWIRRDGKLFDAKGPVPEGGHYTRRYRHLLHQDGCCLRADNEENCWGYYRDPDQAMLEWIGEHLVISLSDKEIQPHTPVDQLPRSQSQSEVKNRLESERVHKPESVKDEEIPRMSPVMMPKGHFVRSRSGLYLPEN